PGNDDVRAFPAERHGDLPADVARGTRDEGRLVLKSSCHGSDARDAFLDWQVQSSSVSYAAEVIDQHVERRLEVPRAPGRAKHLDAALDARDEGRRDPGGVQLRAEDPRGLHLGDALGEVRLPLR